MKSKLTPNAKDDLLINYGSAVKTLEEGHVGGYLVVFSDETEPDLDDDFFTAKTNYGIVDGATTPVWIHHRHPMKTRSGKQFITVKEKVGEGTLSIDDKGVLIDAILYNREMYDGVLEQMGWSSGTASHLVDRKSVGEANEITMWLLGLDASMTPSPAQPQKTAVSLKSAVDAPVSASLDSLFVKMGTVTNAPLTDAEKEAKAKWSASFVNDLPDSSFAYIAPGGELDEESKTAPRKLRYFPYKDADGKLDSAHVKNALSRIPQAKISDAAKKKAMTKIAAAAKKLGVEVAANDSASKGVYLDELERRYRCIYSLLDVLECCLYRLDYAEDMADDYGISIDVPTAIHDLFVECEAEIQSYFKDDEDEEDAEKAITVPVAPKMFDQHVAFVAAVMAEQSKRAQAASVELDELLARAAGHSKMSAALRGELEDAQTSMAQSFSQMKSTSEKFDALIAALDPVKAAEAKRQRGLYLNYISAECDIADSTATAVQ